MLFNHINCMFPTETYNYGDKKTTSKLITENLRK